jgi:hypothetical protein
MKLWVICATPEWMNMDDNFTKALNNSSDYSAWFKANADFSIEYNEARATVKGDDWCVIPRFNATAQKLYEKQLATHAQFEAGAAKAWNDAGAIYDNKLIEYLKKYNLPSDDQYLIDEGYSMFMKGKFSTNPPNPIIDPSFLIEMDPSDSKYTNC